MALTPITSFASFSTRSVLDPSVILAIEDLELATRLVVEGLRSGPHRSPFHGFSTEFSQHRPYRPGDDFRHLDWKLLARTNRLYSRQFRETTNMSLMIVLDSSASMSFPAGAVSKFRYASIVAGALAYLAVSGGDRAGLMSMTGDALTFVPAKGGRAHLRTLLAQIERLTPAGSWQPARALSRAADLLKRRGLMIVVSDFYDAEDETWRELRRARRRGHDVAMLQIVSRNELTFEYRGARQFEDLESGATRLLDAAAGAIDYRAAMQAFLDRWAGRARREGIWYTRFVTDEPPSTALRHFLVARGAARRSWASPHPHGAPDAVRPIR